MTRVLIQLLEQGFARQQAGDLEAAEANYRRVLSMDPRNEFALNLLGVICVRTMRFDEAIDCLERALEMNPADPETHNNLGLAFKGVNAFDRAAAAFGHSLRINPNQPATLNNLGNALAAVDRHQEAISHFEAALRLDRGYVDCQVNLAVSLNEVGRTEHALGIVDQAIRASGGTSAMHNLRGEILLRMTRYDDAELAFRCAIDIDNSILARINLSTALKQTGDPDSARRVLENVIAQEPHNAEAHSHLGVLLEQLGDIEAAARQFREALRHTPNHASSWFQLAKLKGQHLSGEEIARIDQLLADPATLDRFRPSLFFALAWDRENRKDYAASMRYFIRAQAIKARRFPYDAAAAEAMVDASCSAFPVATLGSPLTDAAPFKPVFIVGMPRSGTSLTEQVLSSHSRVTGAGEVGFVSDLVKQAAHITGRRYPECFAGLTAEQGASLRAGYFRRMRDRFGDAPYLVDKNPLNFNLVGAIAALFPEAKIIWCRRNPVDNCVSIFRLPFDDTQGYAHDLSALGHYYRQHVRLMGHWQSSYPELILQVDYEDTVADLESQARRMLEFLQLPFEDRVLEFHATERIVMTPSAEQVRQPIYKDSVAAWRRYESQLGPLLESLGRNE